jgi:hypothetical protein
VNHLKEMIMNAVKLCIIAVGLMLAGVSARAQNGDDILRKHINAVGGYDNWAKISSMKLTGTMNVQGMDISMTQTVVNEKGMRMDVSVMGMNGYSIITPTEGWIYMPFQPGMDKITPIPAGELKSSQQKMNVKRLQLVDQSNIAKSEYVGMDSVNHVGCYKVRVTDKEGNTQMAFFDAATYYLVRTEAKVKMQDEEEEVDVNFSNFQKQPEGVVIAMTWGSPQGDINFKSIELNKTYDAGIFKPDAEVKK